MDVMFPSNTSDFERGRVIAYRDSGLTYREIEEKTAVKQTTNRRLWDEWLELGKSTLTIGKDPRRHWVTRRVREEYEDGFVIPAVRQGKQVMAWGVIGYNYKGPLYRFDLQACTQPLQYHLQRPFRETPANGINGPKYAEWIIRGPLIEAVRTFTNQRRLPIVMEDNSRVHNNGYCDLTRRDLGYRRLFHPPYSPDLNPIENAWSELQGRLADFPIHARNGDVLWGQ